MFIKEEEGRDTCKSYAKDYLAFSAEVVVDRLI